MKLKPIGFDCRSLGLFRIAFGLTLIGNWFMRVSQGRLEAHYTEFGVMPLRLLESIHPRWSFLDSFSSPWGAKLAFVGILLVYLSYTLGFLTRVCQFLIFAILLSLLHRNPLIDDGSDCVLRMFALWTTFLPLGSRFSMDVRLGRTKTPVGKTFESWAVWLFLVNLSISYLFNAIQKDSPNWHAGTALQFVFWDHIIATPFAVYFRTRSPLWLTQMLTYGSIANEYLLAVLLVAVPFSNWPKRAVAFLVIAFHAGIALFIYIGSFCFIYLSAGLLFIPSADWERIERRFPSLKKEVPADDSAECPASSSCTERLPWFRAGEVAAGVLFLYFMLLVCYNNAVPRWMRSAAETVHVGFVDDLNRFILIPQQWSMFRAPPNATFAPVVEAHERHAAQEGGEEVYDFLRSAAGPFAMRRPIDHPVNIGKYWISYFFRIRQLEYSQFRPQFAQYLYSRGVSEFKVHEVHTQVDSTAQNVVKQGETLVFGGRLPVVIDLGPQAWRAGNISRDQMGLQPMGRFGSFWLHDDQVFVRSDRIGQWVEFEFPSEQDCTAGIELSLTRSYDYGVVRISINGKQAIPAVDGYSSFGIEGVKVPVAQVALKKAGNRLKIEVIGKNFQSSGTFFGLDHLEIQYP